MFNCTMCRLCDCLMDLVVGEPKTCHICRTKCFRFYVEFKYCYYHLDCFKCSICHKSLNKTGQCFKRLSKLYCQEDYELVYGKKCNVCKSLIRDTEHYECFNKSYHMQCFNCSKCQKRVMLNIVIEEEDELICLSCYTPKARKTFGRCVQCLDDVTSYPLKQIDKFVWHLRCFRCYACDKSLKYFEFFMINQQVYCRADYEKILMNMCKFCEQIVEDNDGIYIGSNAIIHKSCAKCSKCDTLIEANDSLCRTGLKIWHYKCSEQDTSQIKITDLDESLESISSNQEVEIPMYSESSENGENPEETQYHSIPEEINFNETFIIKTTPHYENIDFHNTTPQKSSTLNSSYRTPNSGFTLPRQKSKLPDDFLRNHNISYLNNNHYLKRPLSPKIPKLHHYHTLNRTDQEKSVMNLFSKNNATDFHHSTPIHDKQLSSLVEKYNLDFDIDRLVYEDVINYNPSGIENGSTFNYQGHESQRRLIPQEVPPKPPRDLAKRERLLRRRRSSIIEFSRLRDEDSLDFIDVTIRKKQQEEQANCQKKMKKRGKLNKLRKLLGNLFKRN